MQRLMYSVCQAVNFSYMKVGHLSGFFLLFILFSCSKAEIQGSAKEYDGCIEQVIIPVSAHSVSNPDKVIIDKLFSDNGIDNRHYRYFNYLHDTLQTLYPPFTKKDNKTVRVDQYTNGVRIFTGDMVFNFIDNILNFTGGDATKGTSLNTSPQLTLDQLRDFFIRDIEQFDHKGDQFKDTCLKAELGYYNLNAGSGNTKEVLVKAWRVTTKNSVPPSEYPVAYYQDDNTKLITYDNGIRTLTSLH